MVRNLPFNVGNMGLTPGQGGHNTLGQLSLSATTTEPTHPRAGAPQGIVAWLTATRESDEDRAQPKMNKNF